MLKMNKTLNLSDIMIDWKLLTQEQNSTST